MPPRRPRPRTGHGDGQLLRTTCSGCSTEAGVSSRAPTQSILKAQLKAWDKVLPSLTEDPFFAKVVESQKAWAKRVVLLQLLNSADYRLAYEHYFGALPI